MGTKYINSKSSIMDEHLDGTTEHLMGSDTGSRGDMNNEVLVVKLENTTHCNEEKSTLQENVENERKRNGFNIYKTVRRVIGKWRLPTEKWRIPMIGKWRLPTEKWRLLAIVTCVLMVCTTAIVYRMTEQSQQEQEVATFMENENTSIATLASHDKEIKDIGKRFLEALTAMNASQELAMKSMHTELTDNYKRRLVNMNETRHIILHEIKEDLSTNLTRDLLALDQRLVMQITQTENNLENIKTKLFALSKTSEGNMKYIQSTLEDQSKKMSNMQLSFNNEVGQLKMDVASLRQGLSSLSKTSEGQWKQMQSALNNMQSSFDSKVGQLKSDVQSRRQRLSNAASGLVPKYTFYFLTCVIVFTNL